MSEKWHPASEMPLEPVPVIAEYREWNKSDGAIRKHVVWWFDGAWRSFPNCEDEAYVDRWMSMDDWCPRDALSQGGEERARIKFPYQATFDAIGAAVKPEAGAVAISVKAFEEAVNASPALLAALSSSEGWAPIGWQGIETAPKDGTLILLHTGTHVVLARWTITSSRDTLNDTEHGGGDVRANFTREYGWRSASEKDLSGKVFKYWSPIPSPPEGAGDCHIGSCQRHGRCMYSPCRNAAPPAPDRTER